MNEEIKFNVIIPTRERPDTLIHCLRTIVAQNYDNLNIIVSDNFSQDNTKEVVDSFADPRIKYINTGRRLSMSHNWEFALDTIESGWVMFLGDDDGLCPGALQLLNQLIPKYQVEAISSAHLLFQWPGHFDSAPQGQIVVPLTDLVSLRESHKVVRRVFNGLSPYQELPWLYHGGAASITLINRLRNEHGSFFCSLNPDLYSAVVLALSTDKFLSIRVPIAINGASKHSNGTSVMSMTNKELDAAKKFASEDNIPFHNSLIFGKSLQIMLYECYLQSWHIHKGALNLSLLDQLHVAARFAPSIHVQETLQDCRKIASLNNLVFTDNRVKRIISKLLKRLSDVRLSYFRLLIKPSTLNVENVYDASTSVWGIYKFLSYNHFNKHACLVFGFTRRIIDKIRRI